jgi:predicted ATPase
MRTQEDADDTTSPSIFISYRRDDSAGHAGHLYADLVAHFGAGSVFMDTETIEPGADFTVELSREIESCDVLIALIGKQWLQPRLSEPGDYVRQEIQAALDRKLRVIPILLQGARMPSVAQLPQSISELSHKNALEISNSRWRHDVDRLIAALQRRPGATPSPSRRLTNLPLELTSFVGRRAEIEHLQELQSQSRLLALIGPGGVGKTRLAIQLATYLRAKFSGGVWLVELAPITDESLLPQAVAAALDLPEQANRSLEATLEDYLRDRETLLVLDNCEHLVEAAARLVQTLLRSCAKLNVLITSREPLNVPGEVQLFVDRARAVGVQLPADGLAVVAGICRRLDGLPLAIELAAARSHVLSVREIDARLSDRFRLLTGGSRTAAERQRTLEAAVDWSYDQLSEPEQLLFGRLSVFSGRFSLGDAEAVCSGRPLTGAAVLDLLTHLVNKSLLVTEDGRYWLLETMRAYGTLRLAAGGREQEVREQHARHFLSVAQSRAPGQFAHWLDRVEETHDNCRGALGWAVANDPQLGLQLAAALFEFWRLRGHNTEARAWLQALLGVAVEASPLRTGARVMLGACVYSQNDLETARSILEAALAEARELSDATDEMLALKFLSLVMLALGDHEQATACAEKAFSLATQQGDRLQTGQVSQNLGVIRGSVGDVDGARHWLANSVAIQRELGRGDEASTTLALLAAIANLQGDHESADAAILESLQAGSAVKDHRLGWTLDVLSARLVEDRPQMAERLAGAASAMHSSVGIQPPAVWEALLQSALAPARAALGEQAAAAAWEEGRQMHFEEAVNLALAQSSAGSTVSDL